MTGTGEYGDVEGITRRLHSTTDAEVWADQFCRMFEVRDDYGQPIEDAEGLMVGWFANAIEVGRSAGLEQSAKDLIEPAEDNEGRNEEAK